MQPRRNQRWQPSTSLQINWANPITRGLVGSWTPRDAGRELGGAATIQGNITVAASNEGQAYRGAYQASNNYVRIERTPALGYTTRVSFEALIRVKAFQTISAPYFSGVISQYQSDSGGVATYAGPSLRFNPNGALGNAARPTFFVTTGGGVTEIHATGPALAVGVHHLLGTYDGINVSLYVNGALAAQTANTGAFDNSASNWISLLSDYVGATSSFSQNRCLDGDLYLARIYNVAKNASEARQLATNPWQLYTPRRIWVPVQVATGTVALTGNGTTASTGILTPSLTLATTGNQATASQGTVTAATAITVSITGNAATTAQGTVTPAISLAVAGNQATASQGTVTPAGTFSAALTGIAATTAVGTPVASITLAITGNQATASSGLVTPPGNVTAALTGVATTSAVGIIVPSLSLAVTGNSSTASVGTVTPTSGNVVALTGNGVVSAIGMFTQSLTLPLTGRSATASIGTLGVGGWQQIDDSQTPNWVQIVDSQTPNWTPI